MDNRKIYRCGGCGEIYTNKEDRDDHIRKKHLLHRGRYNMLENLEEDIRSQGRDLVKMQKRHEANVTMFNYIQKMLKDAKIPKEEKHAD